MGVPYLSSEEIHVRREDLLGRMRKPNRYLSPHPLWSLKACYVMKRKG